ncbi:MAG: hypothetical protein Q4B29_01815 [Candidatus Saccharibacteria bacterium]|nr:hypothetical protein [Candidatus Saccharibacteria bacterium]
MKKKSSKQSKVKFQKLPKSLIAAFLVAVGVIVVWTALVISGLKTYNPEDYDFNYVTLVNSITVDGGSVDKPVALSIFDPGCLTCAESYRNEKDSGFFEKYTMRFVPFVIRNADGSGRFRNSEIIIRYILAVEQLKSGFAVALIDRLFTGEHDGISYQVLFNDYYSHEEATATIEEWLLEFGLNDGAIVEVREVAGYPEITTKTEENYEIVKNELKVNEVPVLIYDGKMKTGLYTSQ